MRVDILTVCPELLESPLKYSIVGRAQERGLIEIHIHNLRDYTTTKYRKVDDYAFGFTAGMVMLIEPVDKAITALRAERDYDHIIFTAPDAPHFTQHDANNLSLCENIIFLCGHYKGIDQRIREHLITDEYSVGDFVVTGGELPVTMMVDSITRLLPGALGDSEAALNDSFQNGVLETNLFTRPADYKGWKVPDILLSGNEAKIGAWLQESNEAYTRSKRPDLIPSN